MFLHRYRMDKFSIARFVRPVEGFAEMGFTLNLLQQLRLAPAVAAHGAEIPQPLLLRQFRFQNDGVLRPADLHRFGNQGWLVFVGAVEIPHSPDIAGREARHVRSAFVQESSGSDSRALFSPFADQLTDMVVQLCLRQVLLKQFVQRRKQSAEICRFPYIHCVSFPLI